MNYFHVVFSNYTKIILKKLGTSLDFIFFNVYILKSAVRHRKKLTPIGYMKLSMFITNKMGEWINVLNN